MSFTNGTIQINRADALAYIIKRDGDYCTYPGCKHPTRFTPDNPRTLDHYIARANGGEDDVSNLTLMHQRCNNLKSDRKWIIDANGQRVLEPIPYREPKSTVIKRDPCAKCNEGRALAGGQICDLCGSEPQPRAFPKYLQRDPKSCDHDQFFCWLCTLDFVPRKSVFHGLVTGPNAE